MRRAQKRRTTQALLSVQEIRAVRAKLDTPFERALFEWLYTNGARASEPGLARLADVDFRQNRVRLVHLKHGTQDAGVPMAPQLRTALEAWLPVRPVYDDARRDYVFPRAKTADCYTCGTTGIVEREFRSKRGEKTKRKIPCQLCAGTGKCLGVTRHDVRHTIVALFKRAGIPPELHFPHVLRHSAVTHLLDKAMLPTAIQQRVGHKSVETTYGYMHATQAAHAQVAQAFADDGDDE